MLANVQVDIPALEDLKEECFEHLGLVYEPFFIDESPDTFAYPVLSYPEKVNSLTLDKVPHIAGTLKGIKGQYLLFDGERVMNVRRHSGYRVRIDVV